MPARIGSGSPGHAATTSPQPERYRFTQSDSVADDPPLHVVCLWIGVVAASSCRCSASTARSNSATFRVNAWGRPGNVTPFQICSGKTSPGTKVDSSYTRGGRAWAKNRVRRADPIGVDPREKSAADVVARSPQNRSMPHPTTQAANRRKPPKIRDLRMIAQVGAHRSHWGFPLLSPRRLPFRHSPKTLPDNNLAKNVPGRNLL